MDTAGKVRILAPILIVCGALLGLLGALKPAALWGRGRSAFWVQNWGSAGLGNLFLLLGGLLVASGAFLLWRTRAR